MTHLTFIHGLWLARTPGTDRTGHPPTIDHGWREVADDVLGWLEGQGFGERS